LVPKNRRTADHGVAGARSVSVEAFAFDAGERFTAARFLGLEAYPVDYQTTGLPEDFFPSIMPSNHGRSFSRSRGR
jgi:hypothetical protein